MNCKIKKKAQLSTLQMLIIGLVAGAVFIALGLGIRSLITDFGTENTCLLSITESDRLGKVGDLIDLVPPLKCDVKETEITLSDVANEGSRRVSDKLIKQALAEKMVECWKKTGQGKLNPYRVFADPANWGMKSLAIDRDDEGICLRCEEITFSKRLRDSVKDSGIVINNLDYFFLTREVTGGAIPYTAITGNVPSNALIDSVFKTSDESLDAIDLNETYSIIWRFELDSKTDIDALNMSLATFNKGSGTDEDNPTTNSVAIVLGASKEYDADASKKILNQIWLIPSNSKTLELGFPKFDGKTEKSIVCNHIMN